MVEQDRPSILIINPPSPAGVTANREGSAAMGVRSKAGFYYPPQTLAYVTALFRIAKWHTLTLDTVAKQMDADKALRIAYQKQSDLVGIFTAAPFWRADFAWAARLDRPYFFFGPALTYLVSELKARPDRPPILLGDPLSGIVKAAEAMLHGGNAPGLWLPDETDPPTPLPLRSLSNLPRPAWDSLPHERYPFLSLYGGRGCEDQCRWCPYRLGQGNRHDQRAPEVVAAELAWLSRTFHKPRHIFRDAVFAADRDWVKHLLEALTHYPRIPWECESRPEHFYPKLLVRMHALGCQQVKIGLDSASGTLLARWGRLASPDEIALYLEKVRLNVITCRQLRLLCRVFVLIGLPGETEDDLAQTDAFLQTIAAPYISVKRFHRYPGMQPLPGETLSAERLDYWEKRIASRAKPFAPLTRRQRWLAKARKQYQRWGAKQK